MRNRPEEVRPTLSELFSAQSIPMLVAIGGMSVLDGLFAGWAVIQFEQTVLNLHVAIWTFLVVWAGAVGYFAYARVPSAVFGVGLYVVAGAVAAKPVLLFGPRLVGPSSTSASSTVMSVANLFVWTLVLGVLALVVFATGAYFRRRARRSVLRNAWRATRRN